ncbi:hypothetical protein VTK73DRAFT_4300 [Phialemonium thermophilum]|uniref:Uncharacterized protein n=1 Tax=Phialemonium thermophilum TaxID=223376 RepID=A0ABR3VAW3_9PEZI
MGRPAVSSMGAGTTASMSSLSSLGRVAGSMGMAQQMAQQQQAPQQQPPSQPQRSGLDKYANVEGWSTVARRAQTGSGENRIDTFER